MKHTPRVLAPLSLFLILLYMIPSAMAQKVGSRAQTNASRKTRADLTGSLFGAAQTYAAGFGGASQSIAADFNGDGIPDIAVVNPCSSSDCGSGYASVAVMMGNGDGSFQAPVLYASGSYEPTSLAAGDFNGDGVPDLVVASQCAFTCGAGQVSILLGKGDGTFQAPIPYPAGTGSGYFVETGDFNRDGKLDLAVAEQTGAASVIVILLGNGDGTFRAPVGYSTGATFATSLAVGDFNQDGAPDLAVANGAADSVSILLGNGDGTFQTAVVYASGGAFANSVAVGDFNGDGAPDLAVINGCASDNSAVGCSQSGSVAVLLGNGDGTFQPPVAFGSGGNSANSVAVADFNGDGNLDLAVGNLGPSAGGGAGVLGLLLGNGDGTFQQAATFGSGGSLAASVSAAYFNGGGQPDLAVVNQCPTSGSCTNSVVGVLLNTASPFQFIASSTSLASSANPAVSNQAVILTAAVTTGFNNGVPTGSIAFYDGATALSTVALSNGQAAYTAALAATGRHALQAVYSGDTNYAASSSVVLSETVGAPVTLTSSLNPSPLNQAVTFTATIATAGTGGTPTGSVTFMDGANSLGTYNLVNGSVSLSQSALAAGNHSVTASYSGDASFQPGLATLSQAVSQGTTTVLTSSANPANVNQSVVFTAAVTGQDGSAAPGAVAFLQGSPPAIWGTAPLVNGHASMANAFNSANTYPVTAVYLGSPDYQTSTSAALNQVVNGSQSVTTTISLASSGTPSLAGQPVKLTATVTPASGAIPNGELVIFYNGSNMLGSAATANGIAAFTTSSLPAGANSITANYPGDGTYQASTSHVFYQSVQLNPSNTTLSSSLNPSTYGQSVTFTVAVAPQSGTGTPTGNVSIKNGATPIGSVALTNGAGTMTTSSLPAGSLSITASYSGDTSFATSSATVSQTVNVASTTTALTSTPNPSSLNQTVTFTATVTGQYGGTPGGTVTFTQGSTVLGSATPTYGRATITAAFSTVGTYPVIATYSGDVSDGASGSAALNQVIKNISTTTTLASSGTPSLAGQTVTFTATVTPLSGAIPDGETVTFNDSAIPIGVGLTKNGVATLATSTLAAGTHSMTAVYAGDATYQTGTSKTFLQVVSHNASVTTLVPSANPSVYGQALTLTAAVAPASGGGTPTGNVSFKNGTTALASVPLVNGSAAFTTSSLPAGSLPLTASYSGDANFSSSSAALTQVVSQAATTSTITSNPNPSSLSQTVTFTATVAAQYQGSITGSVSFMNGSTTLGSAPIAKNKATFTNAFSTAGTDSITAVYTGDANNQTSTSQALNQVVTNAPTTTTVTSSGSPSFVGLAVTFTATVTSSYGAIPNGELVTFYDSGTSFGTGSTKSGAASMTTLLLTPGVHNITATYAGDSSFESSTSRVFSQTISLNTTTIALTSNASPSIYGQPVTFTTTVSSVIPGAPTPTGTVTFKNGAAALGVATLNAQGSATLTTLTLGAGVYSITVAYSGDTLSAKGTSGALNQTVTQAATTTQLVSSVSPAAIGESVSFTAIVRSATAFATGSVTFTAGSTVLGTGTLNNGSAKLSVTTLPAGATNVTATYAGSANVAGSAGSIVQSVE